MNMLQISLPKSGTFWLANIFSNIVKEPGIQDKAFVKTQSIYYSAKTWDFSLSNMPDIKMYLSIRLRQSGSSGVFMLNNF